MQDFPDQSNENNNKQESPRETDLEKDIIGNTKPPVFVIKRLILNTESEEEIAITKLKSKLNQLKELQQKARLIKQSKTKGNKTSNLIHINKITNGISHIDDNSISFKLILDKDLFQANQQLFRFKTITQSKQSSYNDLIKDIIQIVKHYLSKNKSKAI